MPRRAWLCVVLVLVFMTAACLRGADIEPAGAFFRFSERPAPFTTSAVVCAGHLDGGLLVVGGPTGRDVCRFDEAAGTWHVATELDRGLDVAAFASDGSGIYLLGRRGPRGAAQPVTRLCWDGERLEQRSLPEIPAPLDALTAAAGDGKLYAVGLRGGAVAGWVLDLGTGLDETAWRPLPDGAPCKVPVAAVMHGQLYVMGSVPDDADAPARAYVLKDGTDWQPLTDVPAGLKPAWAVPCGDAHLLVFGKPASTIHAYHVTTDAWSQMGQLPNDVAPVAVAAEGTRFTLIGEKTFLDGDAILPGTKYGWLDHAVVAAFFLGMLWIGKRMASRERSENDFFRGGQRIPFWAAGLSLFATGASAISLMAMPAKSFAEDWIYASGSLVQLLLMPIALFIYVPLARQLKVATAFELLERRFNTGIRMFGSVFFSLNQMLARMAAIMLLPSIALSAICGIPMEVSILLMGVITTVYAAMGGLEAVIWTDVIQAIVMLLAMVLCVVWVFISIEGDAVWAWTTIQSADKLRMWDFSFDFTQPVFYLIVGTSLLAVFGGIGDQNFIQRVQCTPDEKTARKAVMTQLFVAVPLNFCLFGLGTCLYLFYKQYPDMLSPAMKADGVFPLFAAQVLPSGMAGLVVAAIMAATMSTLSSAVNSVANLGVEDFLRRFRPEVSDHACVLAGRILTVLLGAFGTGAALVLVRMDSASVWDIAIRIGGMVHAPMIGVFILAVFTTRANSVGVVAGIVGSLLVTSYVTRHYALHPFGYGTLSLGACVAIGYLFSLPWGRSRKNLDGLTAHTLPGRGGTS